jgi:hypothetical protein
MEAPVTKRMGKNQNIYDNMKTMQWIKRPIGLAVLSVLAICLSVFIVRSQIPPHAGSVRAVLRSRQAVARNCTPNGRFLLFPYAKRIAQIDATACPDDFFQAWQKYVTDVQALAAIQRADTGKALVSVGVAIFAESPLPLLHALPEHPEEAEISLNTAMDDWQNVKHVALRYGIKITPPKYSNRYAAVHNA